MFKVKMWCDKWQVCDGTLQCLPRIGERLTFKGYRFEVKMITYNFADGDSTSIAVDIEVVEV